MTQEEYKNEVRRLRPVLLAVARRYVDDDEAEDTVQDVLMRLWQMLDELRLPLDALATVLVRNRCVSLLRKRHHAVEVPAHDMPDGYSDETGASDGRLDRLMVVIDDLPTLQQTVLRLRHVDGMAMKDIAAITGSSEVAVRKALSRARQTVRLIYQREHDR